MNTENTLNMAAIRNEIRSKRRALAEEKANGQKLIRSYQELRTWLDGHPIDHESGLGDGHYLAIVKSKNAELQSTRESIAESDRRCAQLEADIQELESVTFSEEQTMELAMGDHTKAAQELQDLRTQETSMKTELAKADKALNAARAALVEAHNAKKNALSMQDVSKASDDEAQAQRKVNELQALITNLNNALTPLPSKQAARKLDLATAEAAVWKARFSLLMRDLVGAPYFPEFAGKLETAFAAWVKAGNVFSPERFLNEVLNGETLVNFDPDHIAARQGEAAEELGLPQTFAH